MSVISSQRDALNIGRRAGTAACVLAVAAAVGSFAGPASADIPQFSPRCFFTGGGASDGDSFGGNAASYRNEPVEGQQTVDGTWTHTTRDGRTLQGEVESLLCRRDGGQPGHPFNEFSIATFEGTGTFDGQVVSFSVSAQDHGEPGTDAYRIVISDLDGNTIYSSGGLVDSGNVQIHATNFGHP